MYLHCYYLVRTEYGYYQNSSWGDVTFGNRSQNEAEDFNNW